MRLYSCSFDVHTCIRFLKKVFTKPFRPSLFHFNNCIVLHEKNQCVYLFGIQLVLLVIYLEEFIIELIFLSLI